MLSRTAALALLVSPVLGFGSSADESYTIGRRSAGVDEEYIDSDSDVCSGSERCGPNHGNMRCGGASWTIYCNTDNGWCGDTPGHRDAQEGSEYDCTACGDECLKTYEATAECARTDGRCGPMFNGAKCSGTPSWAVYCNTANGWCGTSSGHKYDSQWWKYKDAYDVSQCPEPTPAPTTTPTVESVTCPSVHDDPAVSCKCADDGATSGPGAHFHGNKFGRCEYALSLLRKDLAPDHRLYDRERFLCPNCCDPSHECYPEDYPEVCPTNPLSYVGGRSC